MDCARKWFAFAVAFSMVAFAAGCGSDSTSPPLPTPCDDADPYLQAISDSLEAIPNDATLDQIQNLRYPEIRAGLDAVLAGNSDCAMAHLGSAIMDVLEINYDAQLWAFIDSLDTYGSTTTRAGGLYLRPGSPILGNQFTILATAPREFMRRAVMGIPDNLTVAELQSIIESTVIPALTSAINHLAAAETGLDPSVLITTEDETHEIDMGEVMFFHAALHAARAGFRIATAYDYSLPGPDGTYGWIDDIRNIDAGCRQFGSFELIGGGPNYRAISTYYSNTRNEAEAESTGIAILQYNLEMRPAFLTQKPGGGMSAAFDDILAARDLLASAVASIRAETDNQVDDVVKLMDLTDLDAEIPGSNPPNFATSFQTVEDVLNWVDEVLSGPYDVSEDGDVGPIEFTIDLSGFFRSAPTDWKALLPYHQFRTTPWTTESVDSYVWPWGGGSYSIWDCPTNDFLTMSPVTEIVNETRRVQVEPIDFLNGPAPGGAVIDLEVEKIPYMPNDDYTLGGLFPGADRDKWLQIHMNAGW